jgi:hypothetical protein
LPSIATLGNGNGLVVSGISGASTLLGQAIPTFTTTVDLYSPLTNSFTAGPSIGAGQARAGASSIVLGNGDVFVAGGVISGLLGIPTATNTTRIYNGAAFVAGPAMTAAAALPGLVTLASGQLLLAGGVNGTLLAPTATDAVSFYNGSTITGIPAMPGMRGAQSVVRLKDGGVLLAGGGDSNSTAQADAWLLTPNH